VLSRRTSLLGAVLLHAAVWVGPAAAQEPPAAPEPWEAPPEIVDGATELLLVEMAILHHLDAFTVEGGFGPPVERLDEVHAAFAPWPAVGDVTLIAALDEVDRELAVKKSILLDSLDRLPGPIEISLDELPDNWLRRLGDGEREFVPAGDYVAALDLLAHDGAPPPPGRARPADDNTVTDAIDRFAGPGIISSYTTAGADDLAARLTLLSEIADDGGDGRDWPLVAALVLGSALLASALVAWAIRRRPERGNHGDSVDSDTLEALRRLAASYDEAEIAHIALEVASTTTGARGGVLLRAAPDGLRVAGSTNVIGGSVLERAISTGQPVLTVVTDDPVVGHTPTAMAAVPVVADGRIEGILTVWREPDRPFTERDRHLLEQLAPTTGGALTSADAHRSATRLAMIDKLTSLGNRRRLDGDLETTLATAIHEGLPVAFAMIDIDDFKVFNDTHGHAAGDAALATVARVIADGVRSSDVVYRYGGEEFSVLLPGATEAEAHAVVERVRAAVESATVPGEEMQPGGRLTVSAGVATLGEDSRAHDIKERADAALYRAKSEGRNRVVVA